MSSSERQRKFKLTPVVVGLVLLLFLIQIVIAHNLANRGEKLRQLEIRARQMEQENAILAKEVNQAASLARIFREAEELGLTKTHRVLHLTPQIPVAWDVSEIPWER